MEIKKECQKIQHHEQHKNGSLIYRGKQRGIIRQDIHPYFFTAPYFRPQNQPYICMAV